MSNNKELMWHYAVALVVLGSSVYHCHLKLKSKLEDMRLRDSVHQFTVSDTHGQMVRLQSYAGQVLLIVNIASRCGLTQAQYTGLAMLRDKYEARGLRILNFPCNQFGNQMPEADGFELLEHMRQVKLNIGSLFAKLEVNGLTAAPLFEMLKRKRCHVPGGEIEWNFGKFLIDKFGYVYRRYEPQTPPSALEEDIEHLLNYR
ncbi:probable phospholipid hydroperoxide glutathione peroxidase [Scaptodrosophila lebanonensis]|uniref:Glutathione peroxidase n=1 Tax=Drosophila lebanonensis TaxID=7225 RepID=A0A6J2UDB9_DROLE|nr:probable phospholipid hydroperoxide glutathione peroxidase [Scaptodrosophila lebanonensis]